MTAFQWLTLSLLLAVITWDVLRFWRHRVLWGPWLLRIATWVAAAIAIALPGLVQRAAGWLGIGRGTDVVLYVFVFIVLGTSFYFYSKYVLLQRQLTQVVRHIAISQARRGRTPPEAADDTD